MICIGIRAGFSCPRCEAFIPVNAMVGRIRCTACGARMELEAEHWKNFLEDPVRECPHMEKGETHTCTGFGSNSFKVEYLRMQPVFAASEKVIPVNMIMNNLTVGYLKCPETDKKISVRPFPETFAEAFPGVKAILGEDEAMLGDEGNDGPSLEVDDVADPVALQCPQCGGNLIVSGKTRTEKCEYCGTDVKLPDDLWEMLHPRRKMIRWFLLYDYSSVPFNWEGEVYGSAGLKDGSVCVVAWNPLGDNLILARMDADRKLFWSTEDIPIMSRPSETIPGMVTDYRGGLLVMDDNRRDLHIVPVNDPEGRQLLKGRERYIQVQGEFRPPLNMEDANAVSGCPDGTILLLKTRDDDLGYYTELSRYDRNGDPLELWPVREGRKEAKKKPGFFARLFGKREKEEKKDEIPSIRNVEGKPFRFDETSMDMSVGPDGTLYLLNNITLAAYGIDGTRKYLVDLPCHMVDARPVGNEAGEALVLVRKNETIAVLKVSADGEAVDFSSDITTEDCDRFETITIASDSILHALGYKDCWIRADTELGTLSRNGRSFKELSVPGDLQREEPSKGAASPG